MSHDMHMTTSSIRKGTYFQLGSAVSFAELFQDNLESTTDPK